MVALLIILLLGSFDARPQVQQNSQSDPVEVVDLEVFMYPMTPRPSAPGPKPAPTPPGLIVIDDLTNGNRKERKDPMTIRNRSIELRTPSGQVISRPAGASSLMSRYEYRLRVRNAGAKKIKTILWEYQLRDASNTSTISSRLFFCAVVLKPRNLSSLLARSPADPINASAEASAAEPRKQRALINRVEYTDGSSWQRPGWQAADSKRPEAISELRDGQCTSW
ncbi:MAG TPA: hypothetical protein VFX97_03190 [Pyrinomonadaceae bacterium]|nr:hypothetical protein [Pyrinomonadaceae bacterium]